MIDVLLVQKRDSSRIAGFLFDIFYCPVDRIKVFSIEGFNALDEQLDDDSFECLCVVSSVRGAVSQLLQLFRCKINDSEVVRRIAEVAFKNKIHCYLPGDLLDEYVFLGSSEIPMSVRQIECDDDDCYQFYPAE